MMAAYSVGCMISGVKMVFLNQSGKKRNKFIYGSIKRFMTITLKHDIFISSQGCILPPCPQGHGQGGFLSRKRIDERFQSNATFSFSKIKWKTLETDKSYLCLPQQIKSGYLNSITFFLANSWLLNNLSAFKKFTDIFRIFNRNCIEDLRARARMLT